MPLVTALPLATTALPLATTALPLATALPLVTTLPLATTLPLVTALPLGERAVAIGGKVVRHGPHEKITIIHPPIKKTTLKNGTD